MKTAERENPNSRAWLSNKPSPWGGRQQAPSLIHTGWKVRNYPAKGDVFFLTFPFIELRRKMCFPVFGFRRFVRQTATFSSGFEILAAAVTLSIHIPLESFYSPEKCSRIKGI